MKKYEMLCVDFYYNNQMHDLCQKCVDTQRDVDAFLMLVNVVNSTNLETSTVSSKN